MISAWWLIPAIMLGVVIGVWLIALLTAAHDRGDEDG